MQHFIFIDTETTGLPDWHTPSDDPSQPHIVELYAEIVTEDNELVDVVANNIVKPEGWLIPQETIDLHGITNEQAHIEGRNEKMVVQDLLVAVKAFSEPLTRVSHNEPFDARIVRIALKRYGFGEEAMDFWKGFPRECTMRVAKKRCGKGALGEAYEMILNKRREGPEHRAGSDVAACRELFFYLRGQGVFD